MQVREQIVSGQTAIGIEFGSTRIKAVLIGSDFAPIASGVHDWSNQLENGIWTYSEAEIRSGLQSCFADLMRNTEQQYGVKLTTAGSIGISAMMHGYLAFDADMNLLVPFRTWRNTITKDAAEQLTDAFSFNIPQRWSIAHLYQAILNKEAHVGSIRHFTTLAGFVHWLLTGKKVLGIGDASGMFPIDPDTKSYDAGMCAKFDALTQDSALNAKLLELLPEIVPAGENAGTLTEAGAKLLDPTGTFTAGVPFCAPEGDAQTGMAATNSITPRTGNVSAGTSIFAMAVLERNLKALHREIDIVTTPEGAPVAMVHCNNCSSDLDAWVKMFGGLLKAAGAELTKPQLYDLLYGLAAEGDPDCSGIISYNYYSGEEITHLQAGKPMLMRDPESQFTVQNLMRSLVYSCMATLKIGMDILAEESVGLDRIYAHGGLFKTPLITQPTLAAVLGTDVTLMQSAGEGGAWGIALLAAYLNRSDRSESLRAYLQNRVFADQQQQTVSPKQADSEGLNVYMKKYSEGLAAEHAAVAQSNRGE
ncbi:MAG: ATPase [Oscillospiraceae bacterium]|nr:ATPase [Oscillospiraceae bacterium]